MPPLADKKALRRQLRALHGGEAARQAESGAICRHILQSERYRKARVIAGYVPLIWEADVTAVLRQALQDGKILALPLCGTPPHMTLRRVVSLEALIPGAYGIPEPPAEAPVVPLETVDLLLTPLEGVDERGFRLGKGGGYYDCLLAECSVPSLGCALSWQRVHRLPADAWDRPLTACADARGIHDFNRFSRKEELQDDQGEEGQD